MRKYFLRHLADSTLRHELEQLVISDRSTTARLIAHIAEFGARKLYLEDGYASMYDYCLGQLKMAEDVACRRIRAARAARRFPLVFAALADGRIHLTGISLLAPHLTEANAEELLDASVHKTSARSSSCSPSDSRNRTCPPSSPDWDRRRRLQQPRSLPKYRRASSMRRPGPVSEFVSRRHFHPCQRG